MIRTDLSAYRERFPAVREYEKRYAHIATTALADRGVAGAVRYARFALAALAGALGEAEAERDQALSAMDNLARKLTAAEAELAELKARRCETCRWWREVAPTFHPGSMDCNHESPISAGDYNPPASFACNRYERREG